MEEKNTGNNTIPDRESPPFDVDLHLKKSIEVSDPKKTNLEPAGAKSNPVCIPELVKEQEDRLARCSPKVSIGDNPSVDKISEGNPSLGFQDRGRPQYSSDDAPANPRVDRTHSSPPGYMGWVSGARYPTNPLSPSEPQSGYDYNPLLAIRPPDSTTVMLDKVEQLVRDKAELEFENKCLKHKIGDMNAYIAMLLEDREAYSVKCETLENQLNSIEQESSEFSERLQEAVREKMTLEIQHKQAIQMAEYWELQYKTVEQIRSSLHQQAMALKDETKSSQSLDQVEIVDSDNSLEEQSPLDIPGTPKSFIVEPIELKECKLCNQTFSVDEDNNCMFHPSRPLGYDGWKKMLPHEAQKPSKRQYKLYYCCWKLAHRRPPGCMGPRKHVPAESCD